MKTTYPFLLAVMFIAQVGLLRAQVKYSEKITDKWPYLYEEFQEGILYFDGSKVSKASFNVDVANQSLVFFEEDQKLKSISKSISIDSLVLVAAKFYKIDDMYEVLAQQGGKALLQKVRIDLNAAAETGGGYGTGSATDATTRLTSVDVANYTGVAYEVMKLELGKGKAFETITGYYLTDDPKAEPQRATRNAFADLFPDADVKGEIKAGGLKLNKAEDLIELFKRCSK
ncbi:MAG: hypothetical protein JXR22_13875 [Prolixibacteraceae bacterium]|nr:hypothetical protein [Prolixibacteraceae bacterium]